MLIFEVKPFSILCRCFFAPLIFLMLLFFYVVLENHLNKGLKISKTLSSFCNKGDGAMGGGFHTFWKRSEKLNISEDF